ncbi:uncharacterized protein BJX67DRAFT_370022 [Aspergillus lucknowensis]|uniref:Glyoxalase-like domain-containing protein n=1 Tax=Aspergillus lucknowensis TaxID=176173 RepID=A0ABR4M3R7_9EURO
MTPSSNPFLKTVPSTRLRQIALLVADLSEAERILVFIYRDPNVAQWGLGNFLIPLGGDIIEVAGCWAKRGDGGYMIIMQNHNAASRKEYIKSRGRAKVIFEYSEEDFASCGMMPELDSHRPSGENPEPLLSPFSAWHACGPEFKSYAPAMAGSANLQLLAATCRLTPDDSNTTAAAKTWERIFGVDRDGSELVFTNGRMIFVEGTAQRPEGLESITVGIKGRKRFNDLIERAKKVGVERDGRVVMVGVEWRFVVLDNPGAKCKI